MNRKLIFRIARLAVALVEIHARQEDGWALDIEELLLEIIRTGIRGYQQLTGEPLDPALIKAEAPL